MIQKLLEILKRLKRFCTWSRKAKMAFAPWRYEWWFDWTYGWYIWYCRSRYRFVSDVRYFMLCFMDPRIYVVDFFWRHPNGVMRLMFAVIIVLNLRQSILDFGYMNPLHYPDTPYIFLFLFGAYLWHWFRGRGF